jgi:hypothetical protein
VSSDKSLYATVRPNGSTSWTDPVHIGTAQSDSDITLAYDSEADALLCVFKGLNETQLFSSYLTDPNGTWTTPVPLAGCNSVTGAGLAEIQYKNTLGYTTGYVFCTYNQP